jgi:thiosulfate/3-mercaptopyruvate sulfurtransferase
MHSPKEEKTMSCRLLLATLLFCLASAAARAAPIVDAAYVQAAAARGAVVWDVRAAPQYRKGHVPGAVSIGDAGAALRNPVTEDFVATAEIEKILGEAGIDPADEIVVYGDRGSALAYFGRFALRYFGAANVSVFHDGIEGWAAAGHPIATDATVRTPVALKLAPAHALSVGTEEVVRKALDGDAQIVDVRTPGEYAGDDVRAIRGGHIPGAINIPYERNWQDPDTALKLARRAATDNRGMALKPAEELKALYARLDPERETIVYCQSGVRAAETAAVLEQLGFRSVKVYDSSWLGYAAKLEARVENETFFNIGAMNARMAALQRRLDAMERLFGEMRTAAARTGECGAKPC